MKDIYSEYLTLKIVLSELDGEESELVEKKDNSMNAICNKKAPQRAKNIAESDYRKFRDALIKINANQKLIKDRLHFLKIQIMKETRKREKKRKAW